MNVLHFIFHQTVAAVQSVAEVCSDLFSQLAVVISFDHCDQIAAVVEIGVAVGNVYGDHSTI